MHALLEWETTGLDSFFDPALGDRAELRAFGETVARLVDPGVASLEAERGLPHADGERVEFSPL